MFGAVTCPSNPITVKVAELDVPPPGAALKTVIVRVPTLSMSLLEIWAVSRVELTNVVGRGEPLTLTTDPSTNPDPLTVRVKVEPNASAIEGEILDIEGAGLRTARVRAAEVPPPGGGLDTTTERLAPAATSDAEICAVSCVLFTKVVVRFTPLTRTTEPEMKPLPVSVRVKAALPAETLAGEMLESEGRGLVIVSVTAAEVPPPGAELATVIETLPDEATSLAGIAAVSCVLLTNVVLRLEPFTRTREPETKLLPLRVSVNAPLPALTLDGEILESEGDGLLTASVKAPEVPPPGAGLTTVIERLPAEA